LLSCCLGVFLSWCLFVLVPCCLGVLLSTLTVILTPTLTLTPTLALTSYFSPNSAKPSPFFFPVRLVLPYLCSCCDLFVCVVVLSRLTLTVTRNWAETEWSKCMHEHVCHTLNKHMHV
jgi:hypothetical protein